MLDLSIIVPIYNVEKYIGKCIRSLLIQNIDYSRYEIILINDGSSDSSGRICNDFVQEYGNIHLITQKNKGLSAARNKGIDVAQGKYIWFVDSDDFIEPNVLNLLLKKIIKDDLDMLRFNYQNVNEEYRVVPQKKKAKKFVNYTDAIVDGTTFLAHRLGYACYACQFLIKTNILKREENKFKVGIYFEDVEWLPRLLITLKKVTSIDTVVYNYLHRTGSITKTTDISNKRKMIMDRLVVIDSVLGINDSSENECVQKWSKSMVSHITLSLLNLLSRDLNHEKKEILLLVKNREIWPLSYYQKSLKQKIWITFFNISPAFYVLLRR